MFRKPSSKTCQITFRYSIIHVENNNSESQFSYQPATFNAISTISASDSTLRTTNYYYYIITIPPCAFKTPVTVTFHAARWKHHLRQATSMPLFISHKHVTFSDLAVDLVIKMAYDI